MRKIYRLLILFCFTAAVSHATVAGEPDALASAIAEMRNNTPDDFAPEKDANKGKGVHSKVEAITEAWETLRKSPVEATRLLLAEADALIAGKEKDYPFLLGASSLLFEMNGLDNAEAIERYWAYAQNHLFLNSHYSFHTAVRMAMLRDERAVPILKHLLPDRQIFYFAPAHSLEIEWPLTLWFTWGVLGTMAEEPLLAVLDDPAADAKSLISACNLLYLMQSMPALERYRKLAAHDDAEIRRSAIWAIGRFGHPDDFPLLEAGLKNVAGPDFGAWQRAAGDYQDLRAVDILIDGMKGATAEQMRIIIGGLLSLPTEKSMAAIKTVIDNPGDDLAADTRFMERARATFDKLAGIIPSLVGTDDWENFMALPETARVDAWKEFHSGFSGDEKYILRPDDRRLTREEFAEAVAEWNERGRITDGKFAWVEDRHVAAVAVGEDIPALIDLRGVVLRRVSDECLMETRILNDLLYRIGRVRYRKVFGICEKVESP